VVRLDWSRAALSGKSRLSAGSFFAWVLMTLMVNHGGYLLGSAKSNKHPRRGRRTTYLATIINLFADRRWNTQHKGRFGGLRISCMAHHSSRFLHYAPCTTESFLRKEQKQKSTASVCGWRKHSHECLGGELRGLTRSDDAGPLI